MAGKRPISAGHAFLSGMSFWHGELKPFKNFGLKGSELRKETERQGSMNIIVDFESARQCGNTSSQDLKSLQFQKAFVHSLNANLQLSSAQRKCPFL